MDALDLASVEQAVNGCEVVYYLIHSMIAGKQGFADADRTAALNMATVASARKVRRIIYLGGLGDADHPDLSKHLRSRHEVEAIFREGAVPVTCLRAAMILGSGSASFEMLRYLVDRLPVMITPRWVSTPCQPIAITDVLGYLHRLPGITRDHRRDLRYRRTGGAQLSRPHPYLRRHCRTDAADHFPCTGADPQIELPLDPPGHACSVDHRQTAWPRG